MTYLVLAETWTGWSLGMRAGFLNKVIELLGFQQEANFLSLVCVQVLVNTACCVLMLMAKLIQCIVFGPLRVSERQVSPGSKDGFLGPDFFFKTL